MKNAQEQGWIRCLVSGGSLSVRKQGKSETTVANLLRVSESYAFEGSETLDEQESQE